jgi:hypothetical protein
MVLGISTAAAGLRLHAKLTKDFPMPAANRIRLHALLIGVVYLLCAIIALLLSFPGIFGSLEAIKATVITYFILDASSLGILLNLFSKG